MELEFSETFQQELPSTYLKFLKKNPKGTEIKISGRYDKRIWNMMSEEDLLKRWTMNGVGEAANYECLKLYTHVQGENIEDLYAHSAHFGRVKLDRVARGFVIGHENGDYLYIDPECSFSLWAYYHDGGEITKISGSFDKFLKSKKSL
ncbi:SMI1/KNR4 family protein [Leeuwenhoekiella marinoflava]|uniref:Knr4/Smi1-like domain-containing protein n=2 Tax=Leeuwenhoekiella marinoflava TaxID=988 RepID=A0A4Q0PQ07_9FLAO|nr:SMI1/KNR4 family protein [Leeuwenhoekiella marinoflava]RXG32292.1 hypothetical protein DSL99_1098 [Leeuwenhoekiella marinoflava]SHE80240.1 hypothetical protein SAMN02745246_01061 [Leeuwenhoekiella marinoflava DSM 3653]